VDNGLPGGYKGQVDVDGNVFNFLPQAKDRHATKGDSRFPQKPENKPFVIDHYAKQNELVPDAIHEFYTHQVQINNGLNDKYVAHSGVGALAVGYYDMSQSYLWKLAHEYVLADNFMCLCFWWFFFESSMAYCCANAFVC